MRRMSHILPLTFGFMLALMCETTHATSLKEYGVITGDTITLGDVFYDLPGNGDRVLGSAPRPGDEITLSARTLLRVAMAMDLEWRPSHNAETITLRRDATIIDYDMIKEHLHTALYDEGISGDYGITIPAQYHRIILPADKPANMVITDMALNHDRRTFIATIKSPSTENPIHHLRIEGSIAPVIKVPVLTRNIANGQTITENDIKYMKIKEHQFGNDMIIDPNDLIGMTARRIITTDRPIRRHNIAAPQVIERGALVTLSLRDGMMNLTTQAKALENGAKGDVIRVVNTASNKTIQAKVIAANEVEILIQ